MSCALLAFFEAHHGRNFLKTKTMQTIDPDLMTDHIKCTIFRIDTELRQNEKRRRELSAARLALQAICEHQFQESGHTHGARYETCSICGFTQKQ